MIRIGLCLLMTIATLAAMSEDERPAVMEEMRVEMVELDVKVTGLMGKTIKGLTAKDFVVTENGKRQEINSFEEVIVDTLPQEQVDFYRPRIMILVDFENTQFANMRDVFPQLRQMVSNFDSANTEIGLAVNADGVQLVQAFTNDRAALNDAIDRTEDYYGEVRNKWAYATVRPDLFTDGATDAATSSLLSAHYRKQLERLRLFVNFLGAYSGNKNVIMISDAWQRVGSQTAFTEGVNDGFYVTSDNLMDLKQIQTAALYNKVTLNVVNTRRPGVDVVPIADTDGATNSISQQEELAALTGGFHYRPNNKGLATMVGRVIDRNEHYYRIRYYSSSDSDKFRSVRVRAKGMGRLVYNMGGYFAGAQQIRNQAAEVQAVSRTPRAMDLNMETDWLTWYPVTFRKYRAYLAVSQRAYDAEGRLVGEQVTTTQLTKKGRYTKVPFQGTLTFDLPGEDISRVEAVIIDMMTGERVVLNGVSEPLT